MVFTKEAGTKDAKDVALQPDGKIVVAGRGDVQEQCSTSSGFALARYNADGSLDTNFGPNANGRVLTHVGNGHVSYCTGSSEPMTLRNDQANAVVVQPDGKIVAAGYATVTYGSTTHLKRIAVARYNSDGSLDTGFGSGGTVVIPASRHLDHETALALALQPNGEITVAGYSRDASVWSSGGPFSLVAARLNADGGMDAGFGTGGEAKTAFDRFVYDEQYAHMGVGVQGDGKVVATVPTDQGFYLVRYNADGSPDTGFGPGGLLNTNISADSSWEQANDVIIQPDGKIVAAGYAYKNATNRDFALVRYEPDGNLDASFGNGGMVTTTYAGSSDDEAYTLALQPDGKIVAAGIVHDGGNSWAVTRYNADGSLDKSFLKYDYLNMNLTGPQGTNDYLLGSVLVQPDGKVVLVGSRYARFSNPQTYFALIRLQGGEVQPDTTAPTVSLTAPADGATVSGSSVTLSADATDDRGVTRVDFYVNGYLVGGDTTAGGDSGEEYSYTWDSETFSDGSARIEARAYDAAGHETISSTTNVTIENTTDPSPPPPVPAPPPPSVTPPPPSVTPPPPSTKPDKGKKCKGKKGKAKKKCKKK